MTAVPSAHDTPGGGFSGPWSPMQVKEINDVAESVREIFVVPTAGEPVVDAEPGAHIQCEVTLSNGQKAHRRYSLVNREGDAGGFRIAVAHSKDGHGGSSFMHRLRVGDPISVGEVRNDFPLDFSAEHALLIAGGIGITPILAMARALSRAGRQFDLHYVGRKREVMAYADEIAAMSDATLVFDGGDRARGLDLRALVAKPMAKHHLYVCGPRPLIEATLTAARAAGWTDDALHFELFGSEPPHAGDRPFVVEFARSGVEAEVPVGATILEIMESLDLQPLYDCRRGECGVCVTEVIAGEIDHRDMNLSEREKRENKLICTCVSRARGDRLILDL